MNTFSPFYMAVVKIFLYYLLECVVYRPIDNIPILILSVTITYNSIYYIFIMSWNKKYKTIL